MTEREQDYCRQECRFRDAQTAEELRCPSRILDEGILSEQPQLQRLLTGKLRVLQVACIQNVSEGRSPVNLNDAFTTHY